MSRRQKSSLEPFNSAFANLAKLKEPPKPRLISKSSKPSKLGASPAPAMTTAPAPAHIEDADLFLREVAGAAPVPKKGGRVGAPPPEPTRKLRPSDDAEVLAELADLCGGDGPFDISDSDEYIEGLGDGIDRRLLKRLRAGEYAVQGHIDLHGAKVEEARERVARFIVESRRAGRRCVLIVHGRGLHSKDSIPVLKQAVRTWLERGQISRSILAFATARPTDGGAGAVYVLLRR